MFGSCFRTLAVMLAPEYFFKGNVGGISERRGWSAYGLFRPHRYHLELNSYQLLVLALQCGGGEVCLHAIPSNVHYNSPHIVSRRTFEQGGCYIANSQARESVLTSSATPAEPAPVRNPQVRVSVNPFHYHSL